MISPDALQAALQRLTLAHLQRTPETAELRAGWALLVQELFPDWEDLDLQAAVAGHLVQSHWWPTPADLAAQLSVPGERSADVQISLAALAYKEGKLTLAQLGQAVDRALGLKPRQPPQHELDGPGPERRGLRLVQGE